MKKKLRKLKLKQSFVNIECQNGSFNLSIIIFYSAATKIILKSHIEPITSKLLLIMPKK